MVFANPGTQLRGRCTPDEVGGSIAPSSRSSRLQQGVHHVLDENDADPQKPVTFGDTAWCLVTNVGTQPISVTSRVVDSAGIVLASTSDPSLEPGQMGGAGYQQQFCYCRCELSIDGSAGDVRATMAVGPGDATRAVLDAR
jgi:hypothetical protein